MDELNNLISMFDCSMDTKRKRHLVGGLLLSVAMFFGGLAITIMSIRNEDDI